MSVALIIGKKTSTGVAGKNVMNILGIPSAEYTFRAAKQCDEIDHIFVSTDCPAIKSIGQSYGATVIHRPDHLCQPDTLTEDVLKHALIEMGNPECIALMFCNTPAIDVNLLSEGIRFLKDNPEWDSAFSVGRFDMFSPSRAKKVVDGQIEPFLTDLNTDWTSLRSSQGACYFVDFTVQVIRRSVIENIDQGQPPLKWMGKKSKAILNPSCVFDLDATWQIPVIKDWLENESKKENQ